MGRALDDTSFDGSLFVLNKRQLAPLTHASDLYNLIISAIAIVWFIVLSLELVPVVIMRVVLEDSRAETLTPSLVTTGFGWRSER